MRGKMSPDYELTMSDQVQRILMQGLFEGSEILLENGFKKDDVNEGVLKLLIHVICICALRNEDPRDFLVEFAKSLSKNLTNIKKQMDNIK